MEGSKEIKVKRDVYCKPAILFHSFDMCSTTMWCQIKTPNVEQDINTD